MFLECSLAVVCITLVIVGDLVPILTVVSTDIFSAACAWQYVCIWLFDGNAAPATPAKL